MYLATDHRNDTFHFHIMHGHKKVIHVKDSFKNNIWGTAGFTLPKLIHVLKGLSANSALKQK